MDKFPNQNEAQGKWPRTCGCLEETLKGEIDDDYGAEPGSGKKSYEEAIENLKAGDALFAKNILMKEISDLMRWIKIYFEKTAEKEKAGTPEEPERAANRKIVLEQSLKTIRRNSELLAELEGISLE